MDLFHSFSFSVSWFGVALRPPTAKTKPSLEKKHSRKLNLCQRLILHAPGVETMHSLSFSNPNPKKRSTPTMTTADLSARTPLHPPSILSIRSGMAPRSANRLFLECEGMQVMSEDIEALITCKKMMKRGECPPLLAVFDCREWFIVEADRFIKDLTIITEYIGDVDYLKNREHNDCDSMMTLLSARDSSKIFVICPDKRSNIALFINGINNHSLDGKRM